MLRNILQITLLAVSANLTFFVCLGSSQVQPPSVKHNPKICSQNLAPKESWRLKTSNIVCPVNMAFFSNARGRGTHSSAETISVSANCCSMPATDIFVEETAKTTSLCPKDFVIVSTSPSSEYEIRENKFTRHEVICRKVNTRRYMLGERKPGAAFGILTPFYRENNIYKRIEIPAAIRFGVARIDRFRFLSDYCIGDPPGSLLVGKVSKKCSGFIYQQLQYIGLPGDPSRGTAVTMFPDCRDLSDIHSPTPECIPWGDEKSLR